MEPHAITPEEGMRAVELKFEVMEEEYERNLQCLPTVLPVDASPMLSHSLCEVVREGLSGAFYSHEATSAALNLFLVRLLRENRVEAENRGLQSCLFDQPQPRGGSDTAFLHLMDYIGHHLQDEITLDDLCELCGLERTYLVTRFKRTVGLSPMRYLHMLRVEQAKRLLATTEKSITEIAYEVGYGSIHYFCRYFKRSTGISPSAYREENRG
jgi:AraC-like DNA-binding protein